MEKQARHFAQQVEFLTNNEIRIEVFPRGTLGTALKVSETVRNGVANLGRTWSGYNGESTRPRRCCPAMLAASTPRSCSSNALGMRVRDLPLTRERVAAAVG